MNNDWEKEFDAFFHKNIGGWSLPNALVSDEAQGQIMTQLLPSSLEVRTKVKDFIRDLLTQKKEDKPL